MKPKWIVVADRISARIYMSDKVGAPIHLITELMNYEGHARAQDLTSDKPGRVASASARTIRHSFSGETDPVEHVLEKFGREIAAYLGRHLPDYDQLTLVAEPHVLGVLRGCLTESVAEKLNETLSKNLSGLTAKELSEYIRSHRWEPVSVHAG